MFRLCTSELQICNRHNTDLISQQTFHPPHVPWSAQHLNRAHCTDMLSPSGFSKYKGESIIGNLGEGLLSPKFNNVLKRGVNNSPLQKKKSPEPSKAAKKVDFKEQSIDEEDAGKPKTITMNCGMIKFQDIVIPPSAPTDLICEECEVAISVLYCRRCKQVFCMRCAEQCHPKPYGEDYHPHEVCNELVVLHTTTYQYKYPTVQSSKT